MSRQENNNSTEELLEDKNSNEKENFYYFKEEKDNKIDDSYKEIDTYSNANNNVFFKNVTVIKMIVIVVFFLITVIISVGYILKDDGLNNKKYYISDYNEKKYEFKTIKVLSVYDSIIARNSFDDNDVRYDFRIKKGKVIVTCNGDEYKIKTINKATKLISTPMGNLSEYASTFVLTSDGKLYSINLYDNSKLILNCKNLESKVKKQNFNFIVKDFEAGFYSEKNNTSGESVLMIIDTNNGKHILKTKKSEK